MGEKMNERKMVDEAIISLDLEYITLEDAANQIAELIKRYGGDAKIQYHYPDYSDTKYLYVYRKRPESDLEMTKRIQYEADQAARREEAELHEFERLKVKFKG
jgi:hypothetical protein